ncbi:hypothetical protein E2C01_006610 [Portunus trituberculatus]|uniref:Uncharacterized protein n=1 Tax=Portunus trituberculatus TaxID=210409 RepID=A0A5B7CWT6_PORTR|nr:hypothetical protein [Portunus trituberculatus]
MKRQAKTNSRKKWRSQYLSAVSLKRGHGGRDAEDTGAREGSEGCEGCEGCCGVAEAHIPVACEWGWVFRPRLSGLVHHRFPPHVPPDFWNWDKIMTGYFRLTSPCEAT